MNVLRWLAEVPKKLFCRNFPALVLRILREYELSIESLGERFSEQLNIFTGFETPTPESSRRMHTSLESTPQPAYAHLLPG
jgi:hypothetical protein